jgi:hypothetical protein
MAQSLMIFLLGLLCVDSSVPTRSALLTGDGDTRGCYQFQPESHDGEITALAWFLRRAR